MPKTKRKFYIAKWQGDDQYSWAVFRTGQRDPVVSGLSQRMALHHKRLIEHEHNK